MATGAGVSWIAAASMFSPDWVFADHRAIGWDTVRGHEAVVSLIESGYAVADPIHLEFDEVIACADDAIGVRYTWHFLDAAGGGPGRLSVGIVAAFEDGLCTSYDQYEPDDREAMLRRFDELAGVIPEPERLWREIVALHAPQDIETLMPCYADDFAIVDHRDLALWDEMRGRPDLRRFLESVMASFTVLCGEVDEVLACDDRVIAVRVTWRGVGADSGGEVTLAIGRPGLRGRPLRAPGPRRARRRRGDDGPLRRALTGRALARGVDE